MSTPNFTQCGIEFTSNLSLYANYTWTGPAEGIWANGQAPPLITLAGCEAPVSYTHLTLPTIYSV